MRKLIFLDYKQMMRAIDELVRAQGFYDRADAYEPDLRVKLPEGPGKKLYLVKHKLTGDKFEIMSISKN